MILKNNSGGKIQLAICGSGNSHLHLLRQKSNCSSHIVTPFMDVLFGIIHSRTLVENLLSVIATHSSVLLTSPDTPARVWHLKIAMNATDHINVVFRKFAYMCTRHNTVDVQLPSTVLSLPLSIAMHIISLP